MIEVNGLTKVYPSGCKAIDNLSLSIEQGEIFALLGPNGAGKTSTIRVLSTLAGFDTGNVVIAGHNVDTAPDKVRNAIGFVSQQTGVDNFLTGMENLLLQGQLYRIEKAALKTRIDELSAYFNLGDSLDVPVMTYSGGMRRKLDIAASLIHKPQVLFLDEPTLGLDINSRQVLWQLIRKLNQEFKLTILLTTHYLEEADRLAHRVGIINAGQIRIIGTPEELKDGISGDAVVLLFESVDDTVNAFCADMREQSYVKNAVWEHNKLHLYLENAPGNIAAIMQIASVHGAAVKTLSLSRPTLDDVFLKYTGTSLEGDDGGTAEEWWSQWAGKGSWGQNKHWGKWADKGDDRESGSTAEEQPPQRGSWEQRDDWKKWAGKDDGDGSQRQGSVTWPDQQRDEGRHWHKDKADK